VSSPLPLSSFFPLTMASGPFRPYLLPSYKDSRPPFFLEVKNGFHLRAHPQAGHRLKLPAFLLPLSVPTVKLLLFPASPPPNEQLLKSPLLSRGPLPQSSCFLARSYFSQLSFSRPLPPPDYSYEKDSYRSKPRPYCVTRPPRLMSHSKLFSKENLPLDFHCSRGIPNHGRPLLRQVPLFSS